MRREIRMRKPMRIITKYEHDFIEKIGNQSNNSDDKDKLTDEEFNELSKLNNSLKFGEEQKDRIRFTSYAGYIGLSSGTLIEILPKPAGLRSSDEENRKIAFQLFLTLVAGGELENLKGYLRFLNTGLFLSREGLEPEETIVEVLANKFLEELYNLIRLNLRREYVRERLKTRTPAGKILVSQTLMKLPHRRDLFIVERELLSPNNPLNRLMRTAVEEIEKIAVMERTLNLIRVVLNLFDQLEVGRSRNPTRELERIRLHRLAKDYEPLLNFVHFLFNHLKIHKEKDRKTWSFLFDMNRVFEYFVCRSLKIESNYNLTCQEEEKYEFLTLIPDITIRCNNNICYILDAKWKVSEKNGNIPNSDIYQIVSYLALLGGKKGVLIYPDLNRDTNISRFLISRISQEPEVVILNLDLWNLFSEVKGRVEERSNSSTLNIRKLVEELQRAVNFKISDILGN